MIRLVGAALLAAGAAWLGFRASAALGARAAAIDEMAQGIALLEHELELDAPTLPRLMQRLEKSCCGPAERLFGQCGRALGRLEEESFCQAWFRLTNSLHELGAQERQALLPLGDILGRCSVQEQRRAADCVRRRLEELARLAHQEHERQGKVYRTLGCSAGAFLIILLL